MDSAANIADLKATSVTSVMKELFAGGFGGAVGIWFGQPLDFVKVRLQSLGGEYKSAMDCVVRSLREEGIRGMYRGTMPPLLNSFMLNAIMFGAYESTQRFLENHLASKDARTFLAGSVGGLLTVPFVTSTDLLKCRLQMDRVKGGAGRYAGPLDCAKQTLRAEGARGLFRGSVLTAWRDGPTCGLYFWMYEHLEVLLPKRLGLGEAATTLTAGGLCGVLSWTVAFPMDVLKTQAQLLPAEALASERSLVAIGRSVVAKHGVRHLYYGLGTCLVRAFPVNAITFFVYKNTLDQLESW